MAAQLTAEALAAVTGIWPTQPPNLRNLLAAEGLPIRWSSTLKAWMSGEQKPFDWTEPEDQAKLQAKILEPVDQDVMAGWLGTLGDIEVGTEYAAVMVRARDYLNKIWPKIDTGGVVARTEELSTDDLAEVWSAARVLDDPELVLEEMGSWALTAGEVLALETVYPEITRMIRMLVHDALVEHLALGGVLTWEQEQVVRTMLGLAADAAIAPAGPSEEPGQEKRGRAGWSIDFEATRTPSEALGS